MFKKSSLKAAFFSFVFFASASFAKQNVTFFSDQFYYSGSISIAESLGYAKNGHYQNNNKAVGYSEFGLKTSINNWQLSFSKVDDNLFYYHPKTLEFLYLTNNKIDLPANQQYILQLDINQYSAYKYSLGRTFTPSSKLSFNVNYSLLQMQSYSNGVIKGSANTNINNDYDFNFNSNYIYTSDPLFGSDNKATLAYGHSVDLATKWQINPQWLSTLSLKNIFSFINWPKLPHSNIDATSLVKTTDSNGYLLYLPNISGKEDFVSRVQTLIPRALFSISYQINNVWNTKVSYLKFDRFEQSRFIAIKQLNNKKALILGVGLNTKSFILGFKTENFFLNTELDNLDFNKAHVFGLTANYRITF